MLKETAASLYSLKAPAGKQYLFSKSPDKQYLRKAE